MIYFILGFIAGGIATVMVMAIAMQGKDNFDEKK